MTAVSTPTDTGRERLRKFVYHPKVQFFIIALIIINAIILGLETWPKAWDTYGPQLRFADRVILLIFCIEIALKLFVERRAFFKSAWNWFDFIVVAIALIPTSGAFSVLRAFRVLRVLRILSMVPDLRRVVEALLKSLPGMGSILLVMVIVFYVSAVISAKLFASAFPEWFGSVGSAMYTLFQVMTLESWSMGIVRPVMEVYPLAWAFFVPFIVVTSFAVLNLFIAIIVNSMTILEHEEREETLKEAREIAHEEADPILTELKALREEVGALRASLAKAEKP